MADVCIAELKRSFGGHVVLDIPTLTVGDGELVALLGPSGCGKTTTLRCIAGAIEVDAGRILIGGRDVTQVPAHRRNVGMVFQHHALFPHMTARENIAYGLQARGLARADILVRVEEALALVALQGLGDRLPRQLSGGQQQRVAMARAVVYRPDVLLLDEPFSSLDAKLRVVMRGEVARLQTSLGVTTIFVTHDQQEALALADRVAVMHQGRIEQVGTPEEVYESPRSAFVADFVGATNVLAATVLSPDGPSHAIVELEGGGRIRVTAAVPLPVGASVRIGVKPESLTVGPRGEGNEGLSGTVTSISYLGAAYNYSVSSGPHVVDVRQREPARHDGRMVVAGDPVTVTVQPGAARVIEP